jgi:hypothetical protein
MAVPGWQRTRANYVAGRGLDNDAIAAPLCEAVRRESSPPKWQLADYLNTLYRPQAAFLPRAEIRYANAPG